MQSKMGSAGFQPAASGILPDALGGVAHKSRVRSQSRAHMATAGCRRLRAGSPRSPFFFRGVPAGYFASFAHESLSVMTRLKTGLPGCDSMGSAVM